jgi:enolase
MRDRNPARFLGRSVFRAVENVNGEIARALAGADVCDQAAIDARLIALDGTPNKARLGANAILAVSLAAASAAAKTRGVPLHADLGRDAGRLLPLPEVQIFGGGKHAAGRIDVQDFMIMAVSARSYEEALEVTFNVYHHAARVMAARGKLAGVADEGGYWPAFDTNEAVFSALLEAIERAGYEPGRDVAISLDIAATDLWRDGAYRLGLEGRVLTSRQMVELMADWCDRYPILSIEDPVAEDDWEGWAFATETLGRRCQLIGDDLFTTNLSRIERGIAAGVGNAVLIKLNQIGTVTETLQAVARTQAAGWLPVISARSGETEDAFIAHLAVATNAGQLKVGSFSRSERMAKWNEVLRIGRQLGAKAEFQGARIFERLRR